MSQGTETGGTWSRGFACGDVTQTNAAGYRRLGASMTGIDLEVAL